MKTIPTFCHIPKTAGSTFDYYLRSQLGIRHINVLGWETSLIPTEKELLLALKICPWARSLAGHGLYPNLDYPLRNKKLLWYAFLREPTRRYVSHYQFQVEGGSTEMGFEEWVSTGQLQDFQVRMIAGKPDLDAAIRILDNRFGAVGMVEEFNASVLMFQKRLGLPRSSNIFIAKKKVHRRSEMRERLEALFGRLQEGIRANNRLDLQLYEHVRGVIWPRQVEDYGRARLDEDLSRFSMGRNRYSLREQLNLLANLTFRTLIYKPVVSVMY